jgi:hypothetical protein
MPCLNSSAFTSAFSVPNSPFLRSKLAILGKSEQVGYYTFFGVNKKEGKQSIRQNPFSCKESYIPLQGKEAEKEANLLSGLFKNCYYYRRFGKTRG